MRSIPRFFLITLLAISHAVLFPAYSYAKTAANKSNLPATAIHSSHIAVVINIKAKPGVSRTMLAKASQPIIDAIKKQPGILKSEFYENINPQLSPDFVHVTHWQNFKMWEEMIVKGTLDKLVAPISALCTIEPRAFAVPKLSD